MELVEVEVGLDWVEEVSGMGGGGNVSPFAAASSMSFARFL